MNKTKLRPELPPLPQRMLDRSFSVHARVV
jgi:hypothetical protein